MTIVFVPGFMLDADLWRDVEPGLAAFGPMVHADLGLDTSLHAMADRALRDGPASFVLIGFSMGGYVAREIVRTAPERVTALVLIATSARGETESDTRRKAVVSASATDEGFGGLSRQAIIRSLHPDRADADGLVERIQHMNRRLGGATFRRQSLLERRDERGRLDEIRCPTLVIAGEADRLRSEAEALELRDGIAGADYEVIPGVGHMIPLEAPQCLSRAMGRWLTARA